MEQYIDKIEQGSTVYDVKDEVSGYVTRNVNDLVNYTDTATLNGQLAEKADVEDIPEAGEIQAGDTGYVTGGAVYNALGVVEAALAEL